MSIFINRVQELAFLEKKYASKEAELVILYGRRRIGKTEIILRFCKNKEHLYFIGRLESKEDTLRRFNNLLIERWNDSALLTSPLQNWDAFFGYLARKSEKRVVLVIDEFPLIVEKFPEIISILQDVWDTHLRKSNIMLILSGSSVGMMEKYALDYKSPLYGRRTGQWKVAAMNVAHLNEFFPAYAAENLIRVYACLDMIPGYLAKFHANKSFEENIIEKMLSKGEFLYEEVEILLREELRDPSTYMSILSAIAGGVTTFNEIHTRTGLDKSLLSKYLFVLESIGMIERRQPLTASYKSKLKGKGALYTLKDNFIDFWFRFVYLNKQELEKGEPAAFFKKARQEFEIYVSKKFEALARELVSQGIAGTYPRVGMYWNKQHEIDILAIHDDSQEVLFGECKWQENAGARSILTSLEEKADSVQLPGGYKKHYVLFAKSFKNKVSEWNAVRVKYVDLKEISRFFLANR